MRRPLGMLLLFLAAPALALAGHLSVRGPELIYRGRPILLQGVAVGDAIMAREGKPASDYTRIARGWNANVVRLDIHPSVWKHQDRATVRKKLRFEVETALAAGLFVIIDWHPIGWPDGYSEPNRWGGDPDLYDPDFQLAQSFWRAMAADYGRDGRILFELWNEPVREADFSDNVPRWTELRPYFQRLVDLIRRAGARNVLIATGNQWAYNLRGIAEQPLRGRDIAYAWHVYAGASENDHHQWAANLAELQRRYPVFVTEWGFQRRTKEHYRGTPQDFGLPFRAAFLNGRRLHFTAWCWSDDWTPAMLRADRHTPTEFGRFVQETLQAQRKRRP